MAAVARCWPSAALAPERVALITLTATWPPHRDYLVDIWAGTRGGGGSVAAREALDIGTILAAPLPTWSDRHPSSASSSAAPEQTRFGLISSTSILLDAQGVQDVRELQLAPLFSS